MGSKLFVYIGDVGLQLFQILGVVFLGVLKRLGTCHKIPVVITQGYFSKFLSSSLHTPKLEEVFSLRNRNIY